MGKPALAAVLLTLAAIQVDAQRGATPQSGSLRTATPTPSGGGGRLAGHPNLNGLWQAMTEANWDILAHGARPGPPQFGALFSEPAGVGIVEGNEIPYQPWAATKKKDNFEKRLTEDPIAKCYLPGVPRITYMPHPFQIFQTPGTTVILYEYDHAVRTIYTDRPHLAGHIDFWLGVSRGRWEGETLVVDAIDFNDKTWFDAAGNFHSDALHVVERYTRTGPDHIAYEVTIDDPKVFTRPWKMTMPLYRRQERNVQLLDYECYSLLQDEKAAAR